MSNVIGAEGAKAIGEALVENQSLASLKYAARHFSAPCVTNTRVSDFPREMTFP